MQLADLEVRFRRGADGLTPAPLPPPPPVPAPPPVAPPPPNNEMPFMDEPISDSYDDDAALNVVGVKANKVGVLYRCRFVGDKQVGKSPMVKEGSEVKRKAPLAYIEQLGTYTPIVVRLRLHSSLHDAALIYTHRCSSINCIQHDSIGMSLTAYPCISCSGLVPSSTSEPVVVMVQL
jgi:biotin carboxyl carrier protein